MPRPVDFTQPAKVIRVEPEKNRIIAKTNYKFILYYDEISDIKNGDTITYTGVRQDDRVQTMPFGFNYNKYLLSQNIHAIYYADSVNVSQSGFSVYFIKGFIDDYMSNNFSESLPYIQTFITANRSEFDSELLNSVSKLGIAHLFAVSGLHISFMALLIFNLLKTLKIKDFFIEIILSIFLFQFIILTVFASSVIRASLMVVLLILNKRFKLRFTAFDLCIYLALFLLIVNPLYYVQLGFILTFLVSSSLLLFSERLNGLSKLNQSLFVSAISFFSTLPIITSFNYSFTPFTILFNIYFVFYTVMLLLPFGYLTFVFPFFEVIYRWIILLFEHAIFITEKHFYVEIRLFFNHMYKVILYYTIFLYILAKPKKIILYFSMFVYLILIYLSPYLSYKQQVTFFHVHGDAILIQDAFNKCNILIDTGAPDFHNSLLNSLKAMQITHFDYVIITHWHYDHFGNLDLIDDYFIINTIITNNNQTIYEEQIIPCGRIHFYIYPNLYDQSNENNHSVVLKVWIAEDIYLFTGDIESERELLLLNEDIKANILKVSHHGSRSSSTEAFLTAVNPKEAVISASANNPFDHPHQEVIERLKRLNITVHQTNLEGTIHFQYIFNKRIKKTVFSP
jgi:competence protein ComEC